MKSTKLKITFKLDERGQPVDCEPYTRTEAHSLVEEVGLMFWTGRRSSADDQFMLLANMAVARQIAYGLPEQALLRRHEAPIERRIVSRLSLLVSGLTSRMGLSSEQRSLDTSLNGSKMLPTLTKLRWVQERRHEGFL